MATAESVKAKLQNLITLANDTTGNTDATLTAAVNALIAGFGQGGGGVSAIASGSFTTAENSMGETIQTGVENLNTFILFATDTVVGYGVKAGLSMFFDGIQNTSTCTGIFGFTNNSGSAYASIALEKGMNSGAEDGVHGFKSFNNSRMDFYDNGDVKIVCGASGTCFGAFIGGVEYKWYAW